MMNFNGNQGYGGKFDGYGQGFYNQMANVNMHGNNFFNSQGQNRGHEVSYNRKNNLERVESIIELRFKKHVKRTRCF